MAVAADRAPGHLTPSRGAGRMYAPHPVAEPVVYCLTRDHDLAQALDAALRGATAFFYNDAARLHQAVILRPPDVVLVDTGAIRTEYGDAGLGPVVDFVRHRADGARIVVRPAEETSRHLVAAEAGAGASLVPSDLDGCVEAVLAVSRS
jgi:hypothetical protein